MPVEDLRRHGFAFAQHGDDEVLRADGGGVEMLRLDLGKLKYLLRAGSEGDLAPNLHRLAVSDHLLELEAQLVGIKPQRLEATVRFADGHGQHGKENVLRADVGVVVLSRGGLCASQGLFGI